MKTVSLAERPFLFISGVEGSGTTMMLQLLDQHPHVAVMGGNYCTPGLEPVTEALNALTEKLWDSRAKLSNTERGRLLECIRNARVPEYANLIVHKRSFPFLDPFHLPRLEEVAHFSPGFPRIIIMSRSPEANTRSILRRGFEKDMAQAAERTRMAVESLHLQLEQLPVPVMKIAYEKIISATWKKEILMEVERFLGLEPKALTAHSTLITGPSTSRMPKANE